jgi:hypothetical protein
VAVTDDDTPALGIERPAPVESIGRRRDRPVRDDHEATPGSVSRRIAEEPRRRPAVRLGRDRTDDEERASASLERRQRRREPGRLLVASHLHLRTDQ